MIALPRASGVTTRRRAALLAGAFAVVTTAVAGCRTAAAPATRTVAGFVPSAGQTAFLDTVQRRTFDWFWETTNPAQRARSRPLADASRSPAWPPSASGSPLSRRRRARLDHARAGARARAHHAALLLDRAAGRRVHERHRPSRLLLSLPRHGARPALQAGRALDDRHRAAADGRALHAPVLRPRRTPATPPCARSPTRIYFRVDWPWARNGEASLTMGWHPERGFIPARWIGYNEAMLLYALALGSPTHPIGPEGVGGVDQQVSVGPLSRAGVRDVRAAVRPPVLARLARLPRHPGRVHARAGHRLLRELASRHARASRVRRRRTPAGGAATPTACGGSPRATARSTPPSCSRDGSGSSTPTGRAAPAPTRSTTTAPSRRPPPADRFRSRPRSRSPRSWRCGGSTAIRCSDGTASSMRSTRRFTDGSLRVSQGRIEPGVGWFDTDYLGIDQGPILLMIENQRSQFVWRLMRENPHLRRGLCRAGFTGDGWVGGAVKPSPGESARRTRRAADSTRRRRGPTEARSTTVWVESLAPEQCFSAAATPKFLRVRRRDPCAALRDSRAAPIVAAKAPPAPPRGITGGSDLPR